MPTRLRLLFGAGTYDPVAAVILLNDAFVEANRNAELPSSKWSKAAAQRIERESAVLQANEVQLFAGRNVSRSMLAPVEVIAHPGGQLLARAGGLCGAASAPEYGPQHTGWLVRRALRPRRGW